jgi:hypothetical protein
MGVPVVLATMAACGSIVTSIKSSWELRRMIKRKQEGRECDEEAPYIFRRLRRAYYDGLMSTAEYEQWYEKFLVAKVEKDSESSSKAPETDQWSDEHVQWLPCAEFARISGSSKAGPQYRPPGGRGGSSNKGGGKRSRMVAASHTLTFRRAGQAWNTTQIVVRMSAHGRTSFFDSSGRPPTAALPRRTPHLGAGVAARSGRNPGVEAKGGTTATIAAIVVTTTMRRGSIAAEACIDDALFALEAR